MITKLLKRLQKYESIPLRIGGARLSAILADSQTKRMIGLMHAERLEPGTCMLFIFGTEARQGIWMRNMLFQIDVAWLDSDKIVVDMAPGLKPAKGTDFKTRYPSKRALYVIEFQSGFLRRHGIRIGSSATFSTAARRQNK